MEPGGCRFDVVIFGASGFAGKLVAEYLAAGSERVWAVRPEQRTVIVFSADGEVRTLRIGDTLTSADAGFAVDGFALPVADIFGVE